MMSIIKVKTKSFVFCSVSCVNVFTSIGACVSNFTPDLKAILNVWTHTQKKITFDVKLSHADWIWKMNERPKKKNQQHQHKCLQLKAKSRNVWRTKAIDDCLNGFTCVSIETAPTYWFSKRVNHQT